MIASMAPDGRHAVRLRRFIGHAAANVLDVEEVTTSEGLAALTPAWEGLLERSDVDHPFSTPAWIRSSWDAYGEPGDLLVLVVRRYGQIVALAPFARRRRTMFGLEVRSIETFPKAPRSDVLLSTHPTQACGAILEHLLREQRGWDVLELSPVPSSSLAYREMRRIARLAGLLTGVLGAGRMAYVCRGDAADAPHDPGGLTLETVPSGRGMRQALEDLFRLAPESSAAGERFHREVVRRAAREGWLRLQFLRSGDRRIAAVLALRYRGKHFIVKAGSHPEFAALSPRRTACLLSRDDAFAEGVSEVDVLGNLDPGALPTRSHRTLDVFPGHLRARCLYLAKFGVVPRLKRAGLLRALQEALADDEEAS